MYIGPKIVTDGLILTLDIANTKSYPGTGTLWTDLSGFVNNGTLINSPTFNSENGGSIVFDGLNDYVDLFSNQLANLINNFSVTIWYKCSNTFNKPFLVNTGTGGKSGFVIEAYAFSSAWKVTKYGVVDIYMGTATSDNLWHQLVLVYSSIGGTFIYIDGLLDVFSSNKSNLKPSTFFNLGRSENGFFNGKIPQIQIHNRVLSSQEIKQNFNATKSRYGL